MSVKARYWTGVCYPENMRDDWKELVEDLLGVPTAYCVHDKDKLQAKYLIKSVSRRCFCDGIYFLRKIFKKFKITIDKKEKV